MRLRRRESPVESGESSPEQLGGGDQITAKLSDGPFSGKSITADLVNGRPPATIDIPGDRGTDYRYCLGELTQGGSSAIYSFLYEI